MKVNCPGCSTEFTLDPKKVPDGGVRARCSVCNGVITVPDPASVLGLGIEVEKEGAEDSTFTIESPSSFGAQEQFSAPAAIAQDDVSMVPEQPITQQVPAVAPPLSQAPAPKRHTNPFLTKDPDQRAKRLARALISDIVTYYPAKHAEGLRDGTLKQLFKEEIKKSYEEYVEQVGREYADSTPYFHEALNDVLAGGKKIF